MTEVPVDLPASVVDALNRAPREQATVALAACCGAKRWVEAMVDARPFSNGLSLLVAAERIWQSLGRDDVLEAFSHHPRIGGDLKALREKFAHVEAQSKDWSEGEQSGVAEAAEETLMALRDGNVAYEKRFGHIFIVCASGKTAAEMLALLQARMHNDPDAELAIAAGEQAKITKLRLAKLDLD